MSPLSVAQPLPSAPPAGAQRGARGPGEGPSLRTSLLGCALPRGSSRAAEAPRRRTAARRRATVLSAVAASERASPLAAAEEMLQWLQDAEFPSTDATLKVRPAADRPVGLTCAAARRIAPGEVILRIPENFSVTALDVASHPVLADVASTTSSDLALLSLWLLWESAQGEGSAWSPYLKTFVPPQLSPILWSQEERETLLQGHSGLESVNQRIAEIEAIYSRFKDALFAASPAQFPSDKFSLEKFKEAFACVLSRAVYLPGADIFALLPVADLVRHSPTAQAVFEYLPDEQAVVLRADKAYSEGEEIRVLRAPELPNLELALQTGEFSADNPYDAISFGAGLVTTDPLFLIKKQLLQEEGFTELESFPLFVDRFPRQLLSYLRLARLTDAAQLPRVTFRADTIVSETNEYEVLMLLLNECKERLQAYPQTLEDDLRIVNLNQAMQADRSGGLFGGAKDPQKDASKAQDETFLRKEKLAAQLRASEKRILSNTVTALRLRLAPIRGIPTKSGMGDPNQEIKDMFGLMENTLSSPKRLLSNFFSKEK